MTIRFHRRLWLATAAAAALTTPAWGQSPASDASGVDEVVVTGQRAADKNAIQTKRETVQIVDAISADDIGQMADFSVGDALKRIAGVNVYTYQGEPRFATIRGFNAHYITTTLDGLQIASPDNQNQTNGGGRQFYLESLPSNIASRIEVYKTSTPDMDGHSIGGQINFAIPSAFDFAKNQTNVSGRIGAQLQKSKYGGDQPTGQAEGFLTRRFGPGQQFGVTLSASYWRRDQFIPQVEQGSSARWYQPSGVASPTPYVGLGPIGVERRWYDYDDKRERESLLGKLDWRPTEALEASATGFYFGQQERAWRNDTIASVGAGALVSNQTANSGTLSPRPGAANAADISQNVRLFKLNFDRKIYGGQGDVKYRFSDKLKLEGAAGYSHADYVNPQESDYFVQNGLAFNYVEGPDGVVFSPVNPDQYNNPALYKPGSSASTPQHFVENYTTDADHYEGKIKLAYNMDRGDEGLGFELGGGAIRNDHAEDYSQVYQLGMPYTLADVLSSDQRCGLNCQGSRFFAVDNEKLQPLLAQYLSTVPAVTNTASHYGKAFSLREDILAGYATARWQAQAWSLIGGLRYEWTDFSTNGYQAVTRRVNGASVTDYQPASAASDYGHLLPSVTGSYDLNPTMRLRAAYSRTLGRPKYTDMAMLGGALNTTDANNPTLKIGNPALKPREADNFDLMYEWYLDKNQGLFSLGLFRKSIKNEIYLLGLNAPIDVGGGVMVNGTVTTPVNSADRTRVQGLEANFVKYFDFLPGPLAHLGVNANAIVSDTKFPIRLADGTRKSLDALPNQARFTSNLALFYEDRRLHARVAWNHTGSFIEERYVGTGTASAADFYRIRWTEPADIVDASVSYDVSRVYTVRVDAINLTGEGVDTNIGRDQEIPVARMKIPVAVMFGVSARF